MSRKLTAVAVLVALVFATNVCADLTLLTKTHRELRTPGTQPQPQTPSLPGMGGVPVPPPAPDATEPVQQTLWVRLYMIDNAWRRDIFAEDPRVLATDPEMSVVRVLSPDGTGTTTLLDWQERTAMVMEDEQLAALGQNLQELQQTLQQIPAGQLPPGFQLPPEMGQFLNPTPPVVTVDLEGPLGQAAVLDLSCEKWKFDIETRDSVEGGGWGHTREESWQLLTEDLEPPVFDRDPMRWEATGQAALWQQAYEQAVAGMEMPEGFPVKSYTIERDLQTGRVAVVQTELMWYDQSALDPALFETPEGFTEQQMDLPGAVDQPDQTIAPN